MLRTIPLLLATTLVLWASAFVGIRFGLRAYAPSELAALRFCVASAALLLVGPGQRIRLPARADLPRLLVLGAMGVTLYNLALNLGERTVGAGEASLIVNTVPLLTALLGCAFLRERLTTPLIAGAMVSFTGVGLISLGSTRELSVGAGGAWVALAALAQAVFFVGQRALFPRYRPLEATCYTIWSGTLLLIPLAPGLPGRIVTTPWEPTLVVCYLGLFPAALANLCWSKVLACWTASSAAQFLFAVPVITMALGAWLLGEIPGLMVCAGGVLALAGVALGRFRTAQSECGVISQR